MDTDRFFEDSSELTNFSDRGLNIFDDNPSIYYTGNICKYFRKFKQINRSEHGRGANEFINISEYDGENCYIPSGIVCFLKCINLFSRKILAWGISNSYNHIKEEQILWLAAEFQIF